MNKSNKFSPEVRERVVRISWFNHQRLFEPVGYMPPAEAEANYYRQFASQATTVEV